MVKEMKMNTTEQIVAAAEISEQKRWRFNRYITIVKAAGIELAEYPETQNNAIGIVSVAIEGKLNSALSSSEKRDLMQRLYTEEKAAFPRVKK
jgi:hypothetical protein